MNSWPGCTSQSGAASSCGILMASFVASGCSTWRGSLPVTFLPNRSCVSSTARYAPAASLNDSFATPLVSVVKPFSATTLPSGQLFGFDRSLPGSPSPASPPPNSPTVPPRFRTGQRGPVHSFRRLQVIDLHAALGHLRLAVQGLGLQLQLDRLVLGLPILGADHRFEGGVADADGAVGGARLARAVGHIGVDLEHKGRLVLLRHLRVGLGGELDLERAVGRRPWLCRGRFPGFGSEASRRATNPTTTASALRARRGI